MVETTKKAQIVPLFSSWAANLPAVAAKSLKMMTECNKYDLISNKVQSTAARAACLKNGLPASGEQSKVMDSCVIPREGCQCVLLCVRVCVCVHVC